MNIDLPFHFWLGLYKTKQKQKSAALATLEVWKEKKWHGTMWVYPLAFPCILPQLNPALHLKSGQNNIRAAFSVDTILPKHTIILLKNDRYNVRAVF